MLFNSLDKLKRSMVMMIIVLLFAGLTMFVVPVSYIPILGKALGFCCLVLAITKILDFVSSKKAMIHYIRLTLGLLAGFAGILLFAVETFLPNPGDYSFITGGIAGHMTTKWWATAENVSENGMYGQKGMLFNETIWNAFGGTLLVALVCALAAGTIGTLVGYCVS